MLQSPELKGDTLVYTVKILQGDMPAKGADVSIFIDIIGMPLTPLSYAGWRGAPTGALSGVKKNAVHTVGGFLNARTESTAGLTGVWAEETAHIVHSPAGVARG